MPVYDFDQPQRFVVGTVGPSGDEFRVTTVSLAWDTERRVVIIEAYHDHTAHERTAQLDSDTPRTETAADTVRDQPDQLVRVTLLPEQARAFATRAKAVVSAGRPPCPFCGGPLDRTGHVCPRANGYRR